MRRRSARPRADSVAVVAHPERGRSRLRPGRDAPCRPHHRDRPSRRAPRTGGGSTCAPCSAGPLPDLAHIEGVTNVVVDGRTVECDVVGSMEPLMPALAGAGLEHDHDPRAVARGAVHIALRRRRGRRRARAREHDCGRRPAGAAARRAARTSADAAVARHAFRQVWTSAIVCAIAFGGTAAASALSYVCVVRDAREPSTARGDHRRRHGSGRTARSRLRDRHGRRLHRLQGLRLPHDDRRDLGGTRGDPPAAGRGGCRALAARAGRRARARRGRPRPRSGRSRRRSA